MAVRPWHLLSLCDGYGGTELALRSVARVRTVARVERDSYAAAVLVARMEETRLDLAPVWDDLCTFDGQAWRGRVDIIAAGFPCQPFSAAGARGGVDDDRWLWPDIGRIVADVEPGWVLLENVSQLVRHGLPEVLHDLAQLGFDAEWGLLSAAAVGAPHKRERFWLVAHSDRDGQQEVGVDELPRRDDSDGRDGALCDVGYAGSEGRPEVTRRSPGHETADGWKPDGGHVADGASETDVDNPQNDRREHSESRRSESDYPWPPRPSDHFGWQRWIAQGGPEPVVRRSTDGPPVGLADALHLGGNGLVPQCAAEAWRQLIERGGWLT